MTKTTSRRRAYNIFFRLYSLCTGTVCAEAEFSFLFVSTNKNEMWIEAKMWLQFLSNECLLLVYGTVADL